MKKIVKFIFVFVLIGILAFNSAQAQTWDCGAQGNNLTATLSNDTLYINGSGAMEDYSGWGAAPWHGYPITVLIIGNNVTSIGDYAFMFCSGFTGDLIIPNPVTSIGDCAFVGCSGFTGDLIIPNPVTSIGDCAFVGCSGFTGDLIIGNSVKTIGNSAFNGCSGFDGNLIIGDSVVTIGDYAFGACSGIDTLKFNAIHCTTMGSPWHSVFTNCSSLKTLNIGNNVTHIPDWSFYDCLFTGNLTIPNSVKTIGERAFSGCSGFTGSLTIPNSVLSIGDYVFAACYGFNDTLTISDSITNIGIHAFGGCSNLIGTLKIPNSLTSISDEAFTMCNNLISLTIPNSITNIGNYAFNSCNGLTYITSQATVPPTLGNDVFSVTNTIPVYVPCASKTVYETTNGWNYFTNYQGDPAPDTITYYQTKCYGVGFTDVNFNTPIFQIGTYYQTLLNSNNCDSVVCLVLSEYPQEFGSSYSASFCQGGTYNDQNFSGLTSAGNYPITLINANGCDSIVTLHLSVNAAPVYSYNANLCSGSTYSDANFSGLTTEDNYYKTWSDINGCDSIMHLYLSVISSPKQELCMISVDMEYHNEIIWKKQEEVVSYNIYRESNISGQYELATNINYTAPNSWIDTISNARTRSYSYKISAIDSCGNESEISSAHKTMHLTISQGVGNSWNLIWTPYEGTNYSTYNIYRAIGNTLGSLTLIGTMSSSNTSFSDFLEVDTYVYYMVEIVLNESCNLSKSSVSIKSNIATNNPNGITGIDNYEIEIGNLQVYPNPTNGIITVKTLPATSPQDASSIQIYDIIGHCVAQFPSFGGVPERRGGQFSIDISHLPSGIYFLKVDNTIRKIIKE